MNLCLGDHAEKLQKLMKFIEIMFKPKGLKRNYVQIVAQENLKLHAKFNF